MATSIVELSGAQLSHLCPSETGNKCCVGRCLRDVSYAKSCAQLLALSPGWGAESPQRGVRGNGIAKAVGPRSWRLTLQGSIWYFLMKFLGREFLKKMFAINFDAFN